MLSAIGAIASSFLSALKLYTAGIQNVPWTLDNEGFPWGEFLADNIHLHGSWNYASNRYNQAYTTSVVDLTGKKKLFIDMAVVVECPPAGGSLIIRTYDSAGNFVSDIASIPNPSFSRTVLSYDIALGERKIGIIISVGGQEAASAYIYNVWAE